MIRIQQLKLPSGHSKEALESSILKTLHCKKEELISFDVVKRSIDARKKPDIKFVYTIDAKVSDEELFLKKCRVKTVSKAPSFSYLPPAHGTKPMRERPVIAGAGPAGLFCGLLLAREGYRPILLERGECVEERLKTVETFWKTGALNEESNIQFGEGGAGTFSDGKLNTAVKDASGRNSYVLKTFVEFGAPEEILYLNKPHIGTDILSTVVRNIRKELIRLGGEVRFHAKLTDIKIRNGEIFKIIINHTEELPCEHLVLAVGHSARDTFTMLNEKGILMTAKPFAIGLRIEHPQDMIDFSQYGRAAGKELPVSDYKLTRQMNDGRGVYSFCMCPGGYVVNASSEKGCLAVNGMSYHDRAGKNANSAMVVTVSEKDFGSGNVLAGMEFQRRLEKSAFQAGQGKVPLQLLGDFCQGVPSSQPGDVLPCIKGEYLFTELSAILPDAVSAALKKGILDCGNIIKGFDRPDAVLAGVESRTSSPVRIYRDEHLESSVRGLYPCGEGAGYAGGITSAAMDGVKAAEMLISHCSEKLV